MRPLEQTSRASGIVAYGILLFLSGATSLTVARVLQADSYGIYASRVAAMNLLAQLFICGFNYCVLREVEQPALKQVTGIFSLITIGIAASLAGPLLIFFDEITLVSALIVALGQIFFASLARLAIRNSALKAQVYSAAVLLAATYLLLSVDRFSSKIFLILSSSIFMLSVLVALRPLWQGEQDVTRNLLPRDLTRYARRALVLHFLYTPIPLLIAILPGIAAVQNDNTAVSSLAISATFGTMFQALANFLNNSVFLPNLSLLREKKSAFSVLRRELGLQTLLVGTLSIIFVAATLFVGRVAIPYVLGNSFSNARDVLVLVAILYAIQALYVTQTSFGLMCWPPRRVVRMQCEFVIVVLSAVGISLMFELKTQLLVLLVAISLLICLVIASIENLRMTE